jgi:hypothetical protein
MLAGFVAEVWRLVEERVGIIKSRGKRVRSGGDGKLIHGLIRGHCIAIFFFTE